MPFLSTSTTPTPAALPRPTTGFVDFAAALGPLRTPSVSAVATATPALMKRTLRCVIPCRITHLLDSFVPPEGGTNGSDDRISCGSVSLPRAGCGRVVVHRGVTRADQDELTPLGPGGFGSVERARAHPAHVAGPVRAFVAHHHLAFGDDVEGVGFVP